MRSADHDQPSLTGLTLQPAPRPGPGPAGSITDPAAFTAVTDSVRDTLQDPTDPWTASPYRWLKELPPRRRGRAGALIVHRWLSAGGLLPTRHGTRTAELTINSRRILVKLSTRWEDDTYVWQALRPDDNDTLALLGISPHHANLWFVPQPLALSHATTTGSSAWLSVHADHHPTWLEDHGGTPEDARATLLRQH